MSVKITQAGDGRHLLAWGDMLRDPDPRVRIDAVASINPAFRRSDSGALFLARELEFLEAAPVEETYEELRAKDFIPPATNVPVGADSVSYDQYGLVGSAKVISDGARDLPASDAVKQNFQRRVLEIGTFFQYSVRELENAAFSGVPLDHYKSKSAHRSIEQTRDHIAAFGHVATDAAFTGMLNDTNVDDVTLGGRWSGVNATGAQITDDLNKVVQQTIDASKNSLVADTVLLPPAEYAYARATYIPGTDTSVLAAWLANNVYVKSVDQWPLLATSGASSVAQIVAYRRSGEVLDLANPIDFSMLPPQADGLDFHIPCRGSTAGCRIKKPFAMGYGFFAT